MRELISALSYHISGIISATGGPEIGANIKLEPQRVRAFSEIYIACGWSHRVTKQIYSITWIRGNTRNNETIATAYRSNTIIIEQAFRSRAYIPRDFHNSGRLKLLLTDITKHDEVDFQCKIEILVDGDGFSTSYTDTDSHKLFVYCK